MDSRIIKTTKIYSSRTTIPEEVRIHLGLAEGDSVVWSIENSKVIVARTVKKEFSPWREN